MIVSQFPVGEGPGKNGSQPFALAADWRENVIEPERFQKKRLAFGARTLKSRIDQFFPMKLEPVFFLKLVKGIGGPVVMDGQPPTPAIPRVRGEREDIKVDVIAQDGQEAFILKKILKSGGKHGLRTHQDPNYRKTSNFSIDRPAGLCTIK